MKRTILALAAALTISACATPEQSAETEEGLGLLVFTAAAILAGAALGPF